VREKRKRKSGRAEKEERGVTKKNRWAEHGPGLSRSTKSGKGPRHPLKKKECPQWINHFLLTRSGKKKRKKQGTLKGG